MAQDLKTLEAELISLLQFQAPNGVWVKTYWCPTVGHLVVECRFNVVEMLMLSRGPTSIAGELFRAVVGKSIPMPDCAWAE